jgi:phosphoribosylformylglycinamidine synthase PurS subunit
MLREMKVNVIVMPKAAVLDPQGNAVRDAMRHLGMPEVRSVRIGKYMEIDVDGQNGDLEARLHGLCRDLLSNPVIEDYELLKDREPKLGPRSSARPNERPLTSRAAKARGARPSVELRNKKTLNSDKSRAGTQLPKPKTKKRK